MHICIHSPTHSFIHESLSAERWGGRPALAGCGCEALLLRAPLPPDSRAAPPRPAPAGKARALGEPLLSRGRARELERSRRHLRSRPPMPRALGPRPPERCAAPGPAGARPGGAARWLRGCGAGAGTSRSACSGCRTKVGRGCGGAGRPWGRRVTAGRALCPELDRTAVRTAAAEPGH